MFEFFVAGWLTSTVLLPPLAMNDPAARRRWRAVPHVELWIGTDQQSKPGSHLTLQDVVDLTQFGDSDRRDQMTEMMIVIPAVPGMGREAIDGLARQAMTDMANRFGFMSATETSF